MIPKYLHQNKLSLKEVIFYSLSLYNEIFCSKLVIPEFRLFPDSKTLQRCIENPAKH